ncbi:MAG: hypothetical protein AB1757_17495 [Acidobacteriota bacterium]
MNATSADNPQRYVQPPVTQLAENGSPVFGVELNADEEVIWFWTHYPNGQSVVTGYEIRKKTEAIIS